MLYKKYLVLSVVAVSLTGCGATSTDPRQSFAKSVVDTLAANNWERSAMQPFLCDDRPKDSIDKGISFDLYQDYDGIKAIGKIKLIPVASPPAMAMDTFIPVLFNKQFAPFPRHAGSHRLPCIVLTAANAEDLRRQALPGRMGSQRNPGELGPDAGLPQLQGHFQSRLRAQCSPTPS
jgi:hypothetical protein